MQVLEKHIETPVVAYAKEKYKIKVTKFSALGFRSWPDRVFWIPGGRPLLIEFKRPGIDCALMPAQKDIYDYLKANGYDIEACDNVEVGKRLVDSAMAPRALPKTRR